jgi:hypothetical protein
MAPGPAAADSTAMRGGSSEVSRATVRRTLALITNVPICQRAADGARTDVQRQSAWFCGTALQVRGCPGEARHRLPWRGVCGVDVSGAALRIGAEARIQPVRNWPLGGGEEPPPVWVIRRPDSAVVRVSARPVFVGCRTRRLAQPQLPHP